MSEAHANGEIRWIHDEMLSPLWLKPNVPAIFVFDEAWIQSAKLSLKQIVFMYECLQEMPGVEIHHGDVVRIVQAFARRYHAATIHTVASPVPRLKQQIVQLEAQTIDVTPFTRLTKLTNTDTDLLPDQLKRFSRYWRKVEKGLEARKS